MTKPFRPWLLILAKLCVAALASCGGGSPDVSAQAAAASNRAGSADTIPAAWARIGRIQGLCCHYTPLAIQDGRPMFFSNTLNESVDGQLVRFDGTWSGVGAGRVVLAAPAITDVGPSDYKLRTAGVRQHPSVGWVAIVRVGTGYPTTDGYVPALATSDDGRQWVYRGKLQIEGRVWPGFSDAANLVLQMDKPATLNLQQPFENRYLILENNLQIDNRTRKLIAVISADGRDWRFYRNSAGEVADLWPQDAALAQDQPVFPSADSVQGNIHLTVGDRWRESETPVHAHRHLCAPRGSSTFKFLGNASTWSAGSKAPNLAYDSSTDTLFAVSHGTAYALRQASTACR